MSNIFLTGDSWFVGVHPDLTHKGLQQFLELSGYHVINCSLSGSSNKDSASLLANELSKHYQDGDLIFWVQTDPLRNLRTTSARRVVTKGPPFYSTLHQRVRNAGGINNLIKEELTNDYQQFNNIGKQYNSTIKVIGGLASVNKEILSKFLWVECAAQSWIELLLKDKVQVNWENYVLLCSDWTVTHIDVTGFQNQNLTEFVISELEAMNQLNSIIFNREEFKPDGVHPSIDGHKILFDYLTQKYNLKIGL